MREILHLAEPTRVIQPLAEGISYDGAVAMVALTFRAPGIQALAEERTP